MKNNSITKSRTFCLQQNTLTELTPKAPFDASSGILIHTGHQGTHKENALDCLKLDSFYRSTLNSPISYEPKGIIKKH